MAVHVAVLGFVGLGVGVISMLCLDVVSGCRCGCTWLCVGGCECCVGVGVVWVGGDVGMGVGVVWVLCVGVGMGVGVGVVWLWG